RYRSEPALVGDGDGRLDDAFDAQLALGPALRVGRDAPREGEAARQLGFFGLGHRSHARGLDGIRHTQYVSAVHSLRHTQEGSTVIEIHGIRKSCGGTEVLRGIELSVEAGTVFALLGPNGAGKTTLINILSTLVAPDAGGARIAGYDVVREAEQVKRNISVTGQSAAVDEVLTAAENLRMMGRLSGLGRRAATRRADELLERFELHDVSRKRVGTYSGGMRRRLDLAISLILTPPAVFLDEPT